MKASLRIAVVHYHLRPGGVTSVIMRAAAALSRHGAQVAVVCGGEPPAQLPVPAAQVAGLAYGAAVPAGDLADDLAHAASRLLGGRPDVWHVHNHAIGKSAAMPLAVGELARRGESLLLQIHDFAEDGRPDNYRLLVREVGDGDAGRLGARLYPAGARVHYALLNRHDHDALVRAGADPARTHWLPNPVSLEEPSPLARRTPGLIVYPTRAIRRKNVGEFLLWAARAPAGTRWQTTLEPRSSAERPAYERWRAVASDLNLPVDFAVGVDHPRPMADVLAGAEAVVTTSVAEGFGLSFLEPWLAGRAVAGRNLPDVTVDFREAGVQLGGLYDRLEVPLEWVGRERVSAAIAGGLEQLHRAYGRSCDASAVEAAVAAAVCGDRVDFGRLDESLQEAVLRRMAAGECLPLEPATLLAAASRGLIERNREAVLQHFNAEQYGRRLMAVYEALLKGGQDAGGGPDAARLLDQFLAPGRFHLLRT